MKKILSLTLTAIMLLAAICISASASESYVEDGLVAFYDAGQQSAGTTWTDLTGNGNDITNIGNKNNSGFIDGVFLSDKMKTYFPTGVVDTIKSEEFTIEIKLGEWTQVGASYSPFLNCSNDAFSLFYIVGGKQLILKNNPNSPRPTVNDAEGKIDDATITVTFKSGGKAIIYVDGVACAETEPTAPISIDDFYFGFGAVGETPTSEENSRLHVTEYIKIRVYDRALSAAEVLQNFNADEAEVVYSGPQAETSEEPSTEPTTQEPPTEPTTPTGDSGYVAFALIALVTLAAVVVVKKVK